MSLDSLTHRCKTFALAFTLLNCSIASAGPYADALGKKLVSATTSAEKIILVRWMFTAMSLHPDLKDLSSVTPQQRTEANKALGKMITRMLTENCLTEAREAVKYEGPAAISSAFQLFGQVAARELFGNSKVAEGLSELNKVIDPEIFKKALEDHPEPTSEKSN
jgi:hypothetical protein